MSETQQADLQRGLSNRHLQLIAIGGAIGTGLFMGSGRLASVSGPAILFVYMVIGFFVFFIMRALGELLLSNLNYHTFGDIAKDLLGPWAGFFVSWTYWLSWIVACIADIVAIVGYVQYFNENIPFWIPAVIAATLLLLLNLQPVKWFGETEFWFALIKIVAILSLIAVGIYLIATGFTSPSGTQASVRNLWEHGGLFPTGLHGFLLGFQMGIFGFIGVELVGTASAETKNPHKTLPKAVNSIVMRITIFYIGALAVILSITPWNELSGDKSPFVLTLSLAGFGLAAAAINLVVLTSAASSANSGLYSGTRMLFGLSRDGHAPAIFSKVSKNNIPQSAAIFSGLLVFLSIPLMAIGGTVMEAFTMISTVSSTFILFTWGSIVCSYIAYRMKHPERHEKSDFKMPLGKVMPWLILVFFVFIYFTLLLSDATRVPALIAPLWFVILTGLWLWRKSVLTKAGRPLTRSVPVVTEDER
ncbi:amino acid permease [Canibacter zhoujuaniae]|uniref:amino acid permease n=1 Tax=Canibacter zhoujuaniae TaxID=2708343 RepID=UPI001420B4BE|nr:amino acid permease [Canibacter zhoujuaniae]